MDNDSYNPDCIQNASLKYFYDIIMFKDVLLNTLDVLQQFDVFTDNLHRMKMRHTKADYKLIIALDLCV